MDKYQETIQVLETMEKHNCVLAHFPDGKIALYDAQLVQGDLVSAECFAHLLDQGLVAQAETHRNIQWYDITRRGYTALTQSEIIKLETRQSRN